MVCLLELIWPFEFADKHRFYHFILPQKLHRVVYTFRQKSIKKTWTLKRILSVNLIAFPYEYK